MNKKSIVSICMLLFLMSGLLSPAQAAPVAVPAIEKGKAPAPGALPLELPEIVREHRLPPEFDGTIPEPHENWAEPGAKTEISRPQDSGTASIAGTVKDGGGQVINRWMQIVAESGGSEWIVEVSTADGTYHITDLPAGTYTLYVEGDGVYKKYYDGVYSADDSAPVALGEGETKTGIDFSITGGKISGTVYNLAGTPLTGGRVTLVNEKNNWLRGMDVTEEGAFQIMGIPNGTYTLGTSHFDDYAALYYNPANDGYSTRKAVFFGMTSSSNLSGYDFHLKAESKISGSVRSTGGAPIENAEVQVRPKDGGNGPKVFSDEKGRYTADKLFSPGTYVATASADGYAISYYNGALDQESATPIVLTDTITTTGINFTLSPEARITGRISLADNTPVYNACVYARPTPNHSFTVRDYTDADGNYTLKNLPAGQFYIAVEPNCRNNKGQAFRWYTSNGGTYKSSEAEALTTTAGSTISSINLTVEPGGSISGFIKKTNGNVITDALIRVAAWNDDYSSHVYISQGDGSYTISGLAPGSYRVQANSNNAPAYERKYYGDAYTNDQAVLVPVSSGSTTPNININLAAGGGVSGVVRRASDGAGISGVYVYVWSERFRGISGTTTAGDGTYTINSLPTGKVYVYVGPTTGYGGVYYPNSYNNLGAELVQVTAPAVTQNINFSLLPEGTIQGTVRKGDGSPVKSAQVMVSPFDGGPQTSFTSGADGSFTLHGLAAGRYLVSAQYQGLTVQYFKDATSRSTATAVVVQTSAATAGIDFTLRPGGAISGVLKKTDGSVIKDADIYAAAVGTSPGASNVSQKVDQIDGTYRIQGLVPGTYTVRFNSNRQALYESKYYLNSPGANEAALVTVSAGTDTPLAPAALGPGASIRGSVFKPDGTAADMACVLVSTTAPEFDRWGGWCADSGSAYFLDSLPVGIPLYLKTSIYTDNLAGYQNVWYTASGGTTDGTLAEPIVLAAGATLNGVNMTLAAKGVTVHGRVLNDQGGVISDASIHVQAFDAESGVRAESTTISSEDGTYIITGLKPGRYKLQANSRLHPGYTPKYYNDRYLWVEANVIELGAGQTLENIDFSLPHTVSTSSNGEEQVTLTYAPPSDPSTPVTTVIIPVGAVTQETTFFYAPVDQLTSPYGFNFAGQGFALNAYQGYVLKDGFTFAVPVTITLHYNEADVTDEANLMLNYWNSEKGAWDDAACGAYDRHPAENWLAVPVCHLSDFGLFEKEYKTYLSLVKR